LTYADDAQEVWLDGPRTQKFAFYFSEVIKHYTDNEYIDYGNTGGNVRRLFTFPDRSELIINYNTLEIEVNNSNVEKE
jgi:hypothetical protein